MLQYRRALYQNRKVGVAYEKSSVLLFYLPAIIFTTFYVLVISILGASVSNISPVVVAWRVLFFAAGILLSKDMFWRALLGALPAIHLIYMETQETEQIINGMPAWVILLIFYVVCGGFIFYKGKKIIL